MKAGRYAEGVETLQPLISGEQATTNGYQYLTATYYVGLANEALGNTVAAKEQYEEVMKFWGKPEIETAEIKDARERLARLTS